MVRVSHFWHECYGPPSRPRLFVALDSKNGVVVVVVVLVADSMVADVRVVTGGSCGSEWRYGLTVAVVVVVVEVAGCSNERKSCQRCQISAPRCTSLKQGGISRVASQWSGNTEAGHSRARNTDTRNLSTRLPRRYHHHNRRCRGKRRNQGKCEAGRQRGRKNGSTKSMRKGQQVHETRRCPNELNRGSYK